VPSFLTGSRLNTPDDDTFAGDMTLGAPLDDAPMQEDGTDFWLLDRVGNRFMVLVHVADPAAVDADLTRKFRSLADGSIPLEIVLVSGKPAKASAELQLRVFEDGKGHFAECYDSTPGTVYLIRPDQQVATRWRAFEAGRVKAALARATGNNH
jgi:3-(3-hydroxy-phenyl)propionate hydroxylase